MSFPGASQDMIDLEGLLRPSKATEEEGGAMVEARTAFTAIPPANAVDLAKHPSGIVPVLQ